MPRKNIRDIPPRPTDPTDAALDDVSVARLLGVSRQTLANWRSTRRHLPFFKVDRMVRYQRADVDRFIADRMVRITPEAEGA